MNTTYWLSICITIPTSAVVFILFDRLIRKKEYTAEQVDALLDAFNKRMELLEFKVDNPQPIKVGDRYRVYEGVPQTKSEALKNPVVYVVTNVCIRCLQDDGYDWYVTMTNTKNGECLARSFPHISTYPNKYKKL